MPSPSDPRPHHKGLTPDLVVDRALEMIDEAGPDRLTIRALATRLGVEPMSIYAHVPSKAALLDAVVVRVLDAIVLPDPSLPWQDVLIEGFLAYRRALLCHPRAVPLVTQRTRSMARRLGPMEASLAALHRGGLDPEQMVVAQVTLVAYTLGFVIQEVGSMEPEDGGADLGAVLRSAPGDYPNLLMVAPVVGRLDVNARFERGLVLIVTALGPRA